MGPHAVPADMPCVCGRYGCLVQNRHSFPSVFALGPATLVRARVHLTSTPWSRRKFWSWQPVLSGKPLDFLVWREGHYDTQQQAYADARRYTQGAER